jgi:hypothetical protein
MVYGPIEIYKPAIANTAYSTENIRIALSEGENTIRVGIAKSGIINLYYMDFTPVAVEGEAVAAFFDKNNEETSKITEGTMTAKAKLNGYLQDEDVLLCFAVYKKEIGTVGGMLYKAEMQKVATATGMEKFEKVITDIAFEEGYEYQAKVFIWDDNKVSGKCFTTEPIQILAN